MVDEHKFNLIMTIDCQFFFKVIDKINSANIKR